MGKSIENLKTVAQVGSYFSKTVFQVRAVEVVLGGELEGKVKR